MLAAFKQHLKGNKFSTSYTSGGVLNRSLLNGSNSSLTVSESYKKYKEFHLSTLSVSSKTKKEYRMERFLAPILQFKMAILTPQFIAELLSFWKIIYLKRHTRRSNFDKEIADLRSFLNWYCDTMDFRFQQPIKVFHKKLGVMKDISHKERVITPEDTKLFLSKLNPFYRDFATLQLFCAGRVGEIAGLQRKNINLEKRVLIIREVIVWIKGVPQVKSLPKNGRPRSVYINDTMLEIITRRINQPTDSKFLFISKKGEPLRYNAIAEAYNRAWKKAGLTQYSGTHQLRYGGAQLCRKAMDGSLEAVKSVSGHVSDSMVLKYAEMDSSKLNRDSVLKSEELFNQVQRAA